MAPKDVANRQVGAAVAQLKQFALDPPKASARVLRGQTKDELVKLTGSGLLTTRSLKVGGPPSPDQLTMPAEEGLGAGQQGLPTLAGKRSTQGSQEEPVRWLPVRLDVALEDSQLVAKG